MSQTLFIRMEVRDGDTHAQVKTISMAMPQATLDAAKNPFDVVRHEAGRLYQALQWVGPK